MIETILVRRANPVIARPSGNDRSLRILAIAAGVRNDRIPPEEEVSANWDAIGLAGKRLPAALGRPACLPATRRKRCGEAIRRPSRSNR